MDSEKKYLVKNVNLVQLTIWFNNFFIIKKSGEKFSISDIQGYVRRKQVPAYLGGQEIEIDTDRIRGVKCYSVVDSNIE